MSTSSLPKICLFFEAHQPNRLKPYSFFDIGNDPFYEDDALNLEILNKVSDRCYLPANALLTELIETHGEAFQVSMSLSGVLIEQLEIHRPDVLDSFKKLHATGGLELLGETYYHSMGFHHNPAEFARQVKRHEETINKHFGVKPTVFRHTELIYFNELAAYVEEMGYKAMLAEGVPALLGGRSSNVLYRSPNVKEMKTLLRHGGLSDDITFRFSDTSWSEHPLSSEKFADWCAASGGDVVNLFMDYENIGEHNDEESGIFDFWRALPTAWANLGGEFTTPAKAAAEIEVADTYDCHEPTSWGDEEKDLSAWRGNMMQQEARRKTLLIEEAVLAQNDDELTHEWRKLQTSDHFYYMSTKDGPAGEVHASFSPFDNPYDAYLNFMNALTDMQLRVEK